MQYPSAVNSLFLFTQQRLAYRSRHRAYHELTRSSFCCTTYHHRVRPPPPRSSHALISRTFHSSLCNHADKKYDGRIVDGYDHTNPTVVESRRDDALDSSGNRNNETHVARESFTGVPGTTNTKGKTLAIIFTCKVCNTRSAKQFTEQAYKHGVVLVKCPGCQNHHLIADRLGWFEDRGVDGKGWDVERLLAEVGENVKAVTGNDVLELTLDDITGTKT